MTKEGTVLDGKYEILAEVGRGGMSIVYLARDKRLNKQWAVKEIKNDGKKSAKTLLKGLEREANILKNVDHPVLPRIVDIINQDGTIYVVMSYNQTDLRYYDPLTGKSVKTNRKKLENEFKQAGSVYYGYAN